MLYLLTIIFSKVFLKFSKIRKNKLLPNLLKEIILKNYFKKFRFEKIVIITGSFGKSMTTKIITDLLKLNDIKIINNLGYGEKINRMVSESVKSYKLIKRNKPKILIAEININDIIEIIDYLDIDILLFTNTFLYVDKVQDIGKILTNVNEKIKTKNGVIKTIINVNDVYAVNYINNSSNLYFKMDYKIEKFEEKNLFLSCPICKEWAEFTIHHYGTLGEYQCLNCSNTVIENVNYIMKDIDSIRKTFTLFNESFSVAETKIYELYNWLHSLVIMKELEYSIDKIKATVIKSKVKGFMDTRFYVGENQGIIIPVSNSLTMNFGIEKVMQIYENKVLIFVFDINSNNNYLNFLYDVNMEKIKSESIKKYICTGKGGKIIEERLLYEGIESNKIVLEENLWIVLHLLPFIKAETLCILCSSNIIDNVSDSIKKLQI